MQFTIPFDQSLMPTEIAQAYEHMMSGLPDPASIIRSELPAVAQKAIVSVGIAIGSVKAYYKLNPPSDEKSEIAFFKIIIPHFQAQLIFWTTVLEIEYDRPIGGAKYEKKFFKNKLRRLNDFFDFHKVLYKYYRTGQTDRDHLYFLGLKNAWLNNPVNETDCKHTLAPGADQLMAQILANDKIQHYLTRQTGTTTFSDQLDAKTKTCALQWTASKSGLIELIYALQTGGVYNNGHAGIKEVADTFQQLFKVDLGNYYHAFNEIRLRKKSRTSLLDHLKEQVIQKMDTMDENQTDR